MFFSKKKEREPKLRWKIEIDGIFKDGKPIYHVYKIRSPYGWDYVAEFNDRDLAIRFIQAHMEFPLYFYEGHFYKEDQNV